MSSERQAGQRLEAYNTDQPFLGRIKAAIKRTQLTAEQSPDLYFDDDGYYTINLERARDSADTIGTKVELHWAARSFAAAAQDAFAMNANDLYRDRCQPRKLNNVLMVETKEGDPEDEAAVEGIIEGLADLCVERGVQMGDEGHETAMLNTISGFELAVVMTGKKIDGPERNRYQPGDVLIGIPSHGIHSNGLTDARRLFQGHRPAELRVPTRIYDEVPKLLGADHEIHGLTHITGGGLTKPRTEGLDFHFTETHLTGSADIFYELYERWLHEVGGTYSSGTESHWVDDRAHRKWNSGIGFLVGCPDEAVDWVTKQVPDARVVGYVTEGSGLVVVERSKYTGRRLILDRQTDG